MQEALRHAIESCRPDWNLDFTNWIIELVRHSLKCSIGIFEDSWYEQINGVPTGGSLCVQIANITVFYVLNKSVYSNSDLMKFICYIKRYIDDGTGVFKGTLRQFNTWLMGVNAVISPYGLYIDESHIEPTGSFVNILDIKYMFDKNGQLQTDLFIKATDSRSYLHFSSSHPNHVFSGIVYSQCLRLRRIINCTERLQLQLDSLKEAFLECGYPKKMLENITAKILRSDRILERKAEADTQIEFSPIRVVSSYGSDEDLVTIVKKYEPHLARTRSFSESDFTIILPRGQS